MSPTSPYPDDPQTPKKTPKSKAGGADFITSASRTRRHTPSRPTNCGNTTPSKSTGSLNISLPDTRAAKRNLISAGGAPSSKQGGNTRAAHELTSPIKKRVAGPKTPNLATTNSPTTSSLINANEDPDAASNSTNTSTSPPKRRFGTRSTADVSLRAGNNASTVGIAKKSPCTSEGESVEPLVKAKRANSRKATLQHKHESAATRGVTPVQADPNNVHAHPSDMDIDGHIRLERHESIADATVPEVDTSNNDTAVSGFFSPTYNLLKKWVGASEATTADEQCDKANENIPPPYTTNSITSGTVAPMETVQSLEDKRTYRDHVKVSWRITDDDQEDDEDTDATSHVSTDAIVSSAGIISNHEEGGEEVENTQPVTIQDIDMSVDEDDDLEDEFDPFSFIRSLPPLTKEQLARPCVLPRKTRSTHPITLVLDLDETLVHCSTTTVESSDIEFPVEFNDETYQVSGRLRPYCKQFLEEAAAMFEVVIFTASQKLYAENVLNILDPDKKLIKHRLYRDSCLLVCGNYLKDLTILNRDLMKLIIVDNSPQAFGFQVGNGIPIRSWYEDSNDSELLSLLQFLETLRDVEDVRPYIERTFKLKERVAQARPMSLM
ncbi:hypothetical protein SeMB42_g01397 [Synchytrium endobioticum]|uniref:FCP1 homology domain-containing protein n=1 Tax=Synchytrium endobioticum TaxID=286115 RepID=A0A507DFS4_9FUNG|nr:hypothetical protein SeLEV6574_g01009 [Synchytrium endobioticum]TPX52486.1 hypothetical protein SeMB42_g01397 [Synchytrium endobioticum]